MAETTIEWTATRGPDGTLQPGYTMNPWTGCLRVSPGCDHCYAATLSNRAPGTFGSWEPGAARKRTSEAYWKKPLSWNRKAEQLGVRLKVFCASMADVFDNQAPEDWRVELWRLIRETPHLDWLMLTKRPQNIRKMLPQEVDFGRAAWGRGGPWPNVWLGTTVENQEEADRRIPHLLAVPARVRFLSCEPLLERVVIREHWLVRHHPQSARVDYVICGGESGAGARPMHLDWARSLRDQCAAAGVPFFMKQMGGPVKARMPPIPEDLMVREMPCA
jgi:protein gp37